MNLLLKPSKCRSVSVCSGKSKPITFFIGDTPLPTVLEKPEKFLGSYITYFGKTAETFNIIRDKISLMLSNIDKCAIRNEYKMRVFSDYGLPSLRYILTVHSLSDTQLRELDALQTKYIKTWTNVPKNGATPAVFYSKFGLNIKRISELYLESRTLSFASTLFKGDTRVTNALNTKIDRESKWKKSRLTTGRRSLYHL